MLSPPNPLRIEKSPFQHFLAAIFFRSRLWQPAAGYIQSILQARHLIRYLPKWCNRYLYRKNVLHFPYSNSIVPCHWNILRFCPVKYSQQQDAVLSYGELIDVLIEEEKQWSELPEVSNIAIWKCEAERYAQYDYDQIWNECVLETIDYLKIAKEALNQGILDLGHDTLQKLGCYNSRINGAGNVSAVISIYLFSKYADDPVMAVYETANLNNADTDTLASMVGGLVGALNGKDWIPIELRGVQDYSLFEYLIEQMMDEKCDFLNSDKQYQLFNNEKMATLEIGDSIECLPFGEITLKEIREDKPKRAGMYVKVYVWKTAYGQTIFSKKIGKKTLNMEQTIPHTVEKKHSPEIQFTVQKLKDIKKLLIKVSDAADFVEILSEIVQMKIDDDISKEKIDEMKVKWKPYKITKKQIVSIYELL